ncbi:uncharacterized protein LOC122064452 [Macadamia integrifolia]|uniref:uncharacterized protein LOC122064452 n=1 Tax=Macadamia integrifolia TaxID=60698 RepID=UPI001C4FA7E7|nr:uncharacterized protein LOC122064452 [Macadamia integrifolia]
MELAQIHLCHISKGQLVFPIFFFVEPSHVRNQIGSFEKAFQKHEKNFQPHIIESWKKALREIGNLKGEIIDKNKDQAEIVELVAKRVLDELVSSTYLAECKYPIGIDSRVEDLLSLLSIGSHDVQFIGICGWSGIGKTTIAKAVYNRYRSAFNKHSFVSDVCKQAKQCIDLASLQKRVLKDIFKASFDIGHDHRGKKLMEERLCKENVLLVLDDVDSKEQLDALASELNWFGQGSRIIITSKDEYVLNVAKIDNDKIYWPQELDHQESLQLFSLHAFSKDDPPEDYMKLSHDIVRYSRGLPSTLEALGDYLSDISDKQEWKKTLQKLKAGKASISRLASFRKQRKNTCCMKNNPLSCHPPLHGSFGNTTTVAIASRIFGGCLDLNNPMSIERDGNKRFTDRVGKWLKTPNFKAATHFQLNRGLLLGKQMAIMHEGVKEIGKFFTSKELKKATNNFNESRIIGQGGFGTIYKGILPTGQMVAIKKSKTLDNGQILQFINEVFILSQINHRHVMKLLGCCLETKVPLLVYEFISNGTLYDHIHCENQTILLSWENRLRIAVETADALSYLHSSHSVPIIHRDVKSSNVLLSDNYDVKICDFGASRLLPLDEPQKTTILLGTHGYLDPECLPTGKLTDKSDVYSFGVVLAELLTSKKAVFIDESGEMIALAMYFVSSMEDGKLFHIFDGRIVDDGNRKQLFRVAELARNCLHDSRDDRPTMKEVAQMLASIQMLFEETKLGLGAPLPSSTSDHCQHDKVHEDWLRNDDGYEYFTCSSLAETDECNISWSWSTLELHDAWLRDDDWDEYFTCFSLANTISIRTESAWVRFDDSNGEVCSTSTSFVSTVGCDELSEVINPQGELQGSTIFNYWIQLLTFLKNFFHSIADYCVL